MWFDITSLDHVRWLLQTNYVITLLYTLIVLLHFILYYNEMFLIWSIFSHYYYKLNNISCIVTISNSLTTVCLSILKWSLHPHWKMSHMASQQFYYPLQDWWWNFCKKLTQSHGCICTALSTHVMCIFIYILFCCNHSPFY